MDKRFCGHLGFSELRWPDSRELIRRFARELLQGSQAERFFLQIAFRGARNCEPQVFEAIRANRANAMKTVSLCKSIRATRAANRQAIYQDRICP